MPEDVIEKSGPVSLSDLCREIRKKLFEETVAARVNGKLVDLSASLEEDGQVETVSVRQRKAGDLGSMTLSQFLEKLWKQDQIFSATAT